MRFFWNLNPSTRKLPGNALSRPFIPHEYQKIARDFLLATPRAALYADMGLGKSAVVLTVLEQLRFVGYDEPALVLAPRRVAKDTWPDEVAKWEQTQHLRIVPIMGTPAQRRDALRTKADIHTINYEQIPWLLDALGPGAWPWKLVVADESTILKGMRTKGQGGMRTNRLAEIARMTDYWYNLSGTPCPNGLKDLWGQFWWLDFGERLGRTHTAFCERWFQQNWSGYGMKPLPHAEREIHALVEDITLSLRAADWFDLKEPLVQEVRVKLPSDLRKQYRQLERDMFTQLECGTEVEVFNAAALTTKCLQFCNGAVYTDHPAWKPVHTLKLEALESIVNEAGGAQILVSTAFGSDKARILAAFKEAVDISTDEGLKAFKAGDKQLGIAHPGSMGHGIDGLQTGCWMLVYFGLQWRLDYHQQILERIGPMRQVQSGHADRVVRVWNIVMDDALDDVVLERQTGKRATQDLLLEFLSRRNKS